VRLNIVMLGLKGNRAAEHAMALADAMAAATLPFFVTFLVTRATASERTQMAEFAEKRWNGRPSFAEVYFRDQIAAGMRFSHVAKDTKPLAPWPSMENFYFRVRHHSCAYGSFEMGADGKLRSCAGLAQVHGDIQVGGLEAALAGNGLYELWEKNKGTIEPCGRCALRYACADCCAAELAGEASAPVKTAYCPYDPGGDRRARESRWEPRGFIEPL